MKYHVPKRRNTLNIDFADFVKSDSNASSPHRSLFDSSDENDNNAEVNTNDMIIIFTTQLISIYYYHIIS